MLENNQLRNILREWEREEVKNVFREINLPTRLDHELVFVIQGVRRCGKSTLLKQLPKHYGLDPKKCYLCNFEDPRLAGLLDHELLLQIVSIAREDWDQDTECYFFFDEIQEVANWQKFLHMQVEMKKNNFFCITGSNSSLLGGELASKLTGRRITRELFPFNYKEFKNFFPKKNIKDYLLKGGFPKSLDHNSPQELLREYFVDIVSRDVSNRIFARNEKALIQVAKLAFDTCGSELSFRKIAVAINLSVDTVKSYLEALEKAYLIFACPYFSFSARKQQMRNKKYYPVDPAMRASLTNTSGRDLGKALEILVFLRLKQKYGEVFYFSENGKGEVDFVTCEGSVVTPYQVSLGEILPRHEKSLQYFYEAYPNAAEPVFINIDNAEDYL